MSAFAAAFAAVSREAPYGSRRVVPPVVQSIAGVRAPRSVPLFDARCGKNEMWQSDHGRWLWGCEAAAFVLGLYVPSVRSDYCSPASVSGFDNCLENEWEARRQMVHLRGMLAQQWKAYRNAKRRPAAQGEGGGIFYRPVAVSCCNHGGSVVCSERDSVVSRFVGRS